MQTRLTSQEIADIEAAACAILEPCAEGVRVRLKGPADGTVILRETNPYPNTEAARRSLRRIRPDLAITQAPRI